MAISLTLMCTPHEVIQIGVGGAARIVQVTPKCLEYIDNSGQERVIDLQECASNLTDITDRQGRLCNSSRWSGGVSSVPGVPV
jgi:hypothetical protein